MIRVVAFDIDGALTRPKGMSKYNDFKNKDGILLGIVTARTEKEMNNYIKLNNLDPTFAKNTFFKIRSLREVKNTFSGAEYVYYGSWLRDRFAAKVAGWEYVQI